METKSNIIKKYEKADLSSKIDIICRYYPQIDEIINERIAGMKYIVWEEKKKTKHSYQNELGVRVKSSNGYSDPTGNESAFKADLENAIRNCNFSENFLEGIPYSKQIIKEAYVLKEMKDIQILYNFQVDCMAEHERDTYFKYIKQEIKIKEVALKFGIEYNSAAKWITKIKKILKEDVLEILEASSYKL